MMCKPAIIFDYGNVIAFFDYARAFTRLGAHMGVSGELFRQRVSENGFPDLLAQFESGRITPEEFATSISAISGLKIPYPEFVEAWKDIFWLNASVAELIEVLKSRGYPLLLGSNTNVLHAAYYRRQHARTIDLFDHLIFSYEVGCLKPDARFYLAAAAAANLLPASCIFIDDVEENVEGARKAGLTGLLYTDTPSLLGDLSRLGVEVTAIDR
jgi:HAD superfamily hydrolase (TIGR01509 family)